MSAESLEVGQDTKSPNFDEEANGQDYHEGTKAPVTSEGRHAVMDRPRLPSDPTLKARLECCAKADKPGTSVV